MQEYKKRKICFYLTFALVTNLATSIYANQIEPAKCYINNNGTITVVEKKIAADCEKAGGSLTAPNSTSSTTSNNAPNINQNTNSDNSNNPNSIDNEIPFLRKNH